MAFHGICLSWLLSLLLARWAIMVMSQGTGISTRKPHTYGRLMLVSLNARMITATIRHVASDIHVRRFHGYTFRFLLLRIHPFL